MMEKELAEFNQERVLEVYTSRQGLDDFVQDANALVAGFTHDMSTGTSRAKTASLARKVATYKGSLDAIGKNLVKDWKDQAAVVDANRKKMRDSLDALKIEARLPLTLWEQEEDARLLKEAAELDAKDLLEEIANAYEMAVLMDNEHNRRAQEVADAEVARLAEVARIDAEKAELAEEQRKADEAGRIQAAEEKARLEAEAAAEATRKQAVQDAQAELDRLASEKAAAEEATKEAEREVIRAEERAKLQAKQTAEREQELIDQAAADAEAARLLEIERQESEKTAAEAEQKRIEANKAHTSKVRKGARASFVKLGFEPEMAEAIIRAIHKNQICNISINY